MEPPPSLTTPSAAVSPRTAAPNRQLPPKENSKSVGSLPVGSEGGPSSPRGGFFSKSPRAPEKDKSPRLSDKDKSPRKAGLRKGSAPVSMGGPLQRDTKQLELVQAALAKKKGNKTPKFSTVGRKTAVPQPKKKGSSHTLNKSGFRPAAVVTELAPLYPNLAQSQILDVLEDEDFDVEAAKVRLSALQDAILKSPMMTKSFLNRQAKFSNDKEESMGSLDNIMQREMARADTPISGSPVLSPGRLGSSNQISPSPNIDASVVVEQALLELDGVLNETREIQLKANGGVPRVSAFNLEPVIAVEETEEDDEEHARVPQQQWSKQQQPKMVVPEVYMEEAARAQEEEVVTLPLASPKPALAKRMSVKRPIAAVETKKAVVEVKKSGNVAPKEEPARLTMVATPVRSSDILEAEDIPVSPPVSPTSGRTKRLPPKILFEPVPKPVVEVPKYVGPAPRAGSLAAAAEAEERSGKLLPDREALLRDLLQQGIISEAEFEERLERIRPQRKISTSEPPPVPDFPGMDAFGLNEDEFADPLSFDAIMSRNIPVSQDAAPAVYGVSPPPKNAVYSSPVMPRITMPKNVVLKGTPPKPLSCGKCGTTMPPELKIEVRFCPSCGNKIR